jgi:hypothetical protein
MKVVSVSRIDAADRKRFTELSDRRADVDWLRTQDFENLHWREQKALLTAEIKRKKK